MSFIWETNPSRARGDAGERDADNDPDASDEEEEEETAGPGFGGGGKEMFQDLKVRPLALPDRLVATSLTVR